MTGFEWTSTPKGDNLHRIILFADHADKTSQTLPFSMFDSDLPEDLWKHLAGYEAKTDDRTIGEDARAREAVGSTVDIEKATYSNTIGSPVLSGFWKDPDFIPADHAFYYVRVLEIPTPRWTTYDAAFYGIERPKNVPATTQDRAYTSPIWYKPKS